MLHQIIGLIDLKQIDTQQIREFLSWAASRKYTFIAGNGTQQVRQAKSTSAWSYFRALRRLFNWAIEEGFVEVSPLTKIHFKPPVPARVEPYAHEDLKRLIAVCDLDIRTGARFTGLRNKAMLLLFLDSGIRRAEMARLRTGDINLETRRATVIGKGNKIGIVPFCSKTAKAIWHYLLEREPRAKTDNLWVTEEGNSFSIDGMDSWFNRLKTRAGGFFTFS
jgi:site-specific recombinase XerD